MSSARSSQIFVIGDVHGCFDEFMTLLEKAKYCSKKHRLILMGDLINKGPHSFEVLRWVREKNLETILGNHEWKFIQDVENHSTLSPVLEKLKEKMGDCVQDWLSWIKSWPIYVEEKDFLLVHGGVVPNEHPSQSKIEQVLNIRYWDGTGKDMKNSSYPAWHDLYKGEKLVIYAHWAKQGLRIKENSIGLDTGCVYGGKLTGLWLPSRSIVQVPALKSYANSIK